MRKKSITATIATMVLMLNSLCLVAGADNSARQQETCQGDPGYGISNISLEQQLSDYLANPNLTSEQRSAAESKINSAIDLRDGKIQTRTTYQTVTLTVTAYTQETNYLPPDSLLIIYLVMHLATFLFFLNLSWQQD